MATKSRRQRKAEKAAALGALDLAERRKRKSNGAGSMSIAPPSGTATTVVINGLSGKRDAWGNFWLNDPIHLSKLSAQEFRDHFKGFAHLVIEPFDNLIMVAGSSETDLADGMRARKLNPRKYGVQKIS